MCVVEGTIAAVLLVGTGAVCGRAIFAEGGGLKAARALKHARVEAEKRTLPPLATQKTPCRDRAGCASAKACEAQLPRVARTSRRAPSELKRHKL